MNITTEVNHSTTLYTHVDALVPEDFDIDNEDHYEALNDAVGPYGGLSQSVEHWSDTATVYIVVFENHRV